MAMISKKGYNRNRNIIHDAYKQFQTKKSKKKIAVKTTLQQ